MKPVAVVAISVGIVLRLAVGEPEIRADKKLQSFYAEMLSARFENAYKAINEAIRLWPTNSRYYGWRAYCASQTLPSQCVRDSQGTMPKLRPGDEAMAQAAIEDYGHALRLNNQDSVAHHNRAWLEHLLGHDSDAAKDWAEAIRIDPDNAVFHVSYGMFLNEVGDLKGAHAHYRSAIELSPAIVDSPFFIRYRERSREIAASLVAEVAVEMENKLTQERDPILEARLGKLFEYNGKLNRAEQLLRDAADQLPDLPLVWLNLGDVLQVQRRPEEAMKCYQKARILEGSLAGPYLRMAEIELLSGSKNEVAQDFRLAVAKWQHANPITAAHNNRLFSGPPQMIDDLLPTTLVWYTAPCEASRAWQGLAELYPQKGEYSLRTHTCEQLPSPHVYEDPR